MSTQEPSAKAYEEIMGPEALASAMGVPAPKPAVDWATSVRQEQNLAPLVMQAKQPTTATEWRSARRQGFNIELPSGMIARVRRTLDLHERLRDGKIPNPLAGIVMESINQSKQMDMSKMNEDVLAQMLVLIDETMVLMFISPKVVMPPEGAILGWTPTEDAITPADIDLQDKIFLYTVAQGGTADLASFRKQAEAIAELVQNGDSVPLSPE